MAGILKPRRREYFIENLGGEKLQNTIVNEMTENQGSIIEHPSMTCLDRHGRKIVRNLWEMPYHTLRQCRELLGKDGVKFREYARYTGDLPKEQPLPLPKKQKVEDPFRAARRRREQKQRPKLRKVPHGVFRGSKLLAS